MKPPAATECEFEFGFAFDGDGIGLSVLSNNRSKWYGCRCGSVGFGGGAVAVTFVAGSRPKMVTNGGMTSALVCTFLSGMRSARFEGDIGDRNAWRTGGGGFEGGGGFNRPLRLDCEVDFDNNAVDEFDRLGAVAPDVVRTRRGPLMLLLDWDRAAGPGAVWGRLDDFAFLRGNGIAFSWIV